MIDINQLRAGAQKMGLTLHKCSEHHFQVCDPVVGELVNVWPTTGRYLSFYAKQGVKSKPGDISDVLSLAETESLKRNHKRQAQPDSIVVDDDPFENNSPRPAQKPTQKELDDMLARRCYLLKLCQARLEMYGGALNRELINEIEEVL